MSGEESLLSPFDTLFIDIDELIHFHDRNNWRFCFQWFVCITTVHSVIHWRKTRLLNLNAGIPLMLTSSVVHFKLFYSFTYTNNKSKKVQIIKNFRVFYKLYDVNINNINSMCVILWGREFNMLNDKYE